MRLGIDLGGTKIEGICLGSDGQEAARIRVPAPKGDYQATIRAIRELTRQLDQHVPTDGPEHDLAPLPLGLGMPGAIDPRTGLIKNANSTWLIGHPLDRDLADALGRDVRLTNDANCFTLSEAADGAASGAEVIFGVILGTGVGGGLVVHGQVLTGPNAIAGEWGHNALPWPDEQDIPADRPCYCGLNGCIETYLSGPALEADYKRQAGTALPAADIATGDDDPIAAACMAQYESRLARSLAMVINILDPDVIVLGGGLSNIDRLYDNVPALWGQWVMSDHVATKLVKNQHGDSSGVRGAACLWPDPGQ